MGNVLNKFDQSGSGGDNVYTGAGTNNITGTLNVTGKLVKPNEKIVATQTILASDSGKTFYLTHATGIVNTLPAPAAGLVFEFVIIIVPTSGNNTVVSNGGADIINGFAIVNSTQVLADTEDSINFVASTCVIGDRIKVESDPDGTMWIVSGVSQAAGGITFTKT
jgi:hypothetical protein